MYDLLVRNARLLDGSGQPAFNGDIGIEDGKIKQIGQELGPAGKEIDVGGK